ncbi:MAG: hypothetical protein R3229_11350 [Alphaproteobacteria bacterium]|nr:hypothetical protein [Alphaproteobacteria bacterium]
MALLAILGKSLAVGLGAGALVFAGILTAGIWLAAAELAQFDGFQVGILLGPLVGVFSAFLTGLVQIRRARTLPTGEFACYILFLALCVALTAVGYLMIFVVRP